MKNKKIIGIIAAVLVVLFIGLVGGTQGETPATTTDGTKLSDVSTSVSSSLEETVGLQPGNTTGDGSQSSASGQSSTQSGATTQSSVSQAPVAPGGNYKADLSKIPAFNGKPYVTVNGNVPGLSAKDRTSTYFENYAPLDSMGRCGVVFACLGTETMPTEERGEIGSVKPTGWHTVKYDVVDGKYLYNRCHLIGFQLSGENANTRNLITGTRYLNVDGMLPFENLVADYIKETGNHVLYRVTPIFKGSELVARGVQIEAYSVEDSGSGVCFNVYCYNNQPGVEITYATGESRLTSSGAEETTKQTQAQSTTSKPASTTQASASSDKDVKVWIPQSGKKYHTTASCSGMKNPSQVTVGEAEAAGYTPCSKCH